MPCKGTVSSEPHASPAARVKEYPNEPHTSGKLFCKACQEFIPVSVHVNMLEWWASHEALQFAILIFWM